MNNHRFTNTWTRRDIILAGSMLAATPISTLADGQAKMHKRPIPGSNVELPVIGQGTWQVFDVASTAVETEDKKRILEVLIEHGGSVVDSSPMYGRAEKVIGNVIAAGLPRDNLFIATKVWTDGKDAGIQQMRQSAKLMNVDTIDLMQVHNLRDTDVHMASINDLKDAGRIRWSGLTHYRADGHAALEREMREYKPDFIQINYSLGEPEAATRLLPVAAELGIAVLVNRPYQSGGLFRKVAGLSVPEWATGFASSWGQFFLKYIVSHPAVTAAIPATSKPHHMLDNLQAGMGVMPDAAMRARMLRFYQEL